jgi:hypothetical protein
MLESDVRPPGTPQAASLTTSCFKTPLQARREVHGRSPPSLEKPSVIGEARRHWRSPPSFEKPAVIREARRHWRSPPSLQKPAVIGEARRHWRSPPSLEKPAVIGHMKGASSELRCIVTLYPYWLVAVKGAASHTMVRLVGCPRPARPLGRLGCPACPLPRPWSLAVTVRG